MQLLSFYSVISKVPHHIQLVKILANQLGAKDLHNIEDTGVHSQAVSVVALGPLSHQCSGYSSVSTN